MMPYKHLFFDLDHTLWDFDGNAKLTLQSLYEDLQLKSQGVHDFELFYSNYLVHNEKLWERYRKGFIKQQDLRVKRMWLTLLDFKIANEPLAQKMSVDFLELLPTRTLLFPDTKEILQYLLDKNYILHLITNGFEDVQHHKLRHSGLTNYFKEVITSESSNSLKPDKAIFQYALNKSDAQIEESIMLGDTPEVDIQGAMNIGMDQVFINHHRTATTLKPTYTVFNLNELREIF